MTQLDLMRRFARNLKDELDDAWMTQKELSEASGVPESSISSYMHAERMPRLDTIINLAYGLGCDIQDLTGSATEEVR